MPETPRPRRLRPAAALALLLAGGLPLLPADDAKTKEYAWADLPKEGQVDRVTVKRVQPGRDKEPTSVNAEVTYKLGKNSRTYLPPGPLTGSQVAPGGARRCEFTQRRAIDLDQLSADWKRYAGDV